MIKNREELPNVLNIPSPISTIDVTDYIGFHKEIDVKRDDLIHPVISGNKWRKLMFNMEEAVRLDQKTILTFGGAYSNHIAATAYAAKIHGLNSIGIIRGETVSNPTLEKAKSDGMQLSFISRTEYRQKDRQAFLNRLNEQYGAFYLVPEGGANQLGVKGCKQIIEEIGGFDYDIVALAAGTGTTAAGVTLALKDNCKCLVFSALKGGGFLKDSILKYSGQGNMNFEMMLDYHFGGYAKVNQELIQFMKDFYQKTGLKLDQVYTAKMMYGLLDQLKVNRELQNAKILIIHTGGLQGNTAIQFD